METHTTSRRLPRILLVASLALNLLLIGAIVGTAAKGGPGGPRSFDLQIGPLGQALPPRDRIQVGRELRQNLRDAGISERDRAAAATTVITLLEADAFDRDTFEETIRSQQTRQNKVRETALTVFVDYINAMTTAERRDVAATLKERMKAPRERN